MLLRQRRLCFFPAVVDLSSRPKTGHGEPMRPRAMSAASPWLFFRQGSLPIRNASELPDFRTSGRSAFSGESSPIRSRWPVSIQTERRPSVALKLGDDAISKQSAPLLLCQSRPRRLGKTNIGGDIARWGHFDSIGIASSPAYFPGQEGEKRRSPSN